MLEDNLLMLRGVVGLSSENQTKLALLALIELMENDSIEGMDGWGILEVITQVLFTGHYHLPPSNAEQAGDTLTVDLSNVDIDEEVAKFREWLQNPSGNEEED